MKIPADFDAEIWSVVAEIPAGRVATYGQLARLIGMPGHARRAGRRWRWLRRVCPATGSVNSQGRTAPGWTGQRELLAAEGVRFRANGCVDLSASGWEEIG